MRKQYILPQTKAQIISVNQLICASNTIGKDEKPLDGEPGKIIYGS